MNDDIDELTTLVELNLYMKKTRCKDINNKLRKIEDKVGLIAKYRIIRGISHYYKFPPPTINKSRNRYNNAGIKVLAKL